MENICLQQQLKKISKFNQNVCNLNIFSFKVTDGDFHRMVISELITKQRGGGDVSFNFLGFML